MKAKTRRTLEAVLAAVIVVGSRMYQAKKLIPKSAGSDISSEIASENNSKLADMKYHGNTVVAVNNDKPNFKMLSKKTYIKLSKLDSLGRAGKAEMCAYYTNVSRDERGDISSVKPSGWHQAFVRRNGKEFALYNRCHILMWKLSGLNADERNLTTGTEQYNKRKGMLSVEAKVLDYVEKSHKHVMYRVTPIYKNSELVPRGCLMEAESEDGNFKLCRYVFNVEDGINIDYATGRAEASSPQVSVRQVN